jgi:GH43 family beta-xylosidase
MDMSDIVTDASPESIIILDKWYFWILITNNKTMKKKLFLFAMLVFSVMAFARTLQAVWTSTCGVKHYTTFSGDWTYSQMESYIASINEIECGVRPKINLNP